jgi:predicted acyl esterase
VRQSIAVAAAEAILARCAAPGRERLRAPVHFASSLDHIDYIERDVMMPLRDGVNLGTVISIPHAKATMKVFEGGANPTFVDVPVVAGSYGH